MAGGAKRAARSSPGSGDIPVDFSKKRDALVRGFLKRGVEFTEELLKENEELRRDVARLSVDGARLRAQVASDDAIRELLRTIEALEHEKKSLLERSNELESLSRNYEGRSGEMEREISDLATLHVAGTQLHTSFRPRRVVRQLAELMGQLVGAEAFVMYLIEPDGKNARAFYTEGLSAGTEPEPVAIADGVIGETCATGLLHMRRDGKLERGSFADPLAVVPLTVEGRPVGAIAVLAMLAHKAEWASVDEELFQLVGRSAGSALLSASLYASMESPLEALQGLRNGGSTDG